MNIFAVSQIIRLITRSFFLRYNEDPAIMNNFFGTVTLCYSGFHGNKINVPV